MGDPATYGMTRPDPVTGDRVVNLDLFDRCHRDLAAPRDRIVAPTVWYSLDDQQNGCPMERRIGRPMPNPTSVGADSLVRDVTATSPY